MPKLGAMPITSPVERISGPSRVSEPGKRLKGSTASFTVWRGGTGSASSPSSARVAPAISWLAILARGTPVALATKGTVREARGLASMMKTVSAPSPSRCTANCRLIRPRTSRARASSVLQRRIVARDPAPSDTEGSAQAESPEWMPAGSMCSIRPPISTVPSRSQRASTSTSTAFSRYWSISTGWSGSTCTASTM